MKRLPIETLTEWIQTNKRFVYVRYGDGEFAIMEHSIEQNCDGVVYSEELAKGIEESIRNQAIVHCVSSIAVHRGAYKWIEKHAPEVEWYDSDQILEASEAGRLWPFRVAVFKAHMLYIGPERLGLAAMEAFGAYDLVEVPLTTAFEELDEIVEEASRQIREKNYRLVGVSAGPAAKIIIDRLSRVFDQVSFIDFGSLLDVYAGVATRSGAKRLTKEQIDDLAWRNFHWSRPEIIVMPYPSIHDLMGIPGLVSESEANFLYQVASKAKGTIVELGTFWGRTAAILARTGNNVISIDNYSYPYHPPVGGPLKKLNRYGLKATFIKGNSTVIPKSVGKVALLYVDSDHTYEHVCKELKVWLPRVTDMVVFHDYGKDSYKEVTRAADEHMKGWRRVGQERTMAAFRRR